MMSFKNDVHFVSLMQVMRSMYDEQQLTDVVLCVQERRYHCHRNILAAASPYFRAMFTINLNEKHQAEVKLYEVDATAMELIVQYAYTGELDISPKNAQNLLATASLLQITPIQNACARFVETQLDVSNCIGIYYFAVMHNCIELKNKAEEHIENNFTKVSQGDEFLELGYEKLLDLLGSNKLNVDKEEIVFEALIRWISHNESRNRHLSQLLPLIRFALLSPRYIQERVLCNKLVVECRLCHRLLAELKEFERNPDLYRGEHAFTIILRAGMIQPQQCVLLIGGVGDNSPAINCYNPLTRDAYYMATLPDCDYQSYYEVFYPACVVSDDNQIFVAGGRYLCRNHVVIEHDSDFNEKFTLRKDVYQYDNDHDCWLPKAPMLFPKSNFSLASVGNSVFCFGGWTYNSKETDIVEKYDILQDKWTKLGKLPKPLKNLSTVVHNGFIYILGGSHRQVTQNIVMTFDPQTSSWHTLAGMPTPRFKFGACVVDDEIYVAGGVRWSYSLTDIETLSSVEIYNIQHNQWRQGPNLPEEIYGYGLFLINKMLYLFGNTEPALNTYYTVVYRLSLGDTVWEKLENNLADIEGFACVQAKMDTRKLIRSH